MSMTKAEIATWSVVGVALAGVVTFAALTRRRASPEPPPTPAAVAEPASDAAHEVAGLAPEKTTELLDEPAGELGDLPVVERSGKAMKTGELRGKFVVADCIFTSCSYTCPAMSLQMAALAKELSGADDVVLASFSVDPERDTVEVLAKYADQNKADKSRWLFFRAEPDVMKQISFDRLKLVPNPDEIIVHSALFALLDRAGRVRAYYSALKDPKWIPKLLADLEKLRREPAK